MSPVNASGANRLYMLTAEQLRDNEGQWRAYNSSGNTVILAGPGSGKTKTLTIKLARMLVEDVQPPRGIACITYNNQCARELKRRLQKLGVEDGKRVSIGTLHSFCLKHIVLPFVHLTSLPKKVPIRVATTEEVRKLQDMALSRVIGHEQWGVRFDRYRRTHLDRDMPEWLSDDEDAARSIEMYEALLDEQGLIDFDGMILIGFHLVKNYAWIRKALAARFPILVVDEYQDLGYALDRIVRSLCFDAGIRLLAVGDPDQSIYGFTGAEPSLLSNLTHREDVETIQLHLNYRCGNTIIQASETALGEERGFRSNCEAPGALFFHERPAGINDQARFICETIIPKALTRRHGRKLGDVAVGKIRLSELVHRWIVFNESLRTDKEQHEAQIKLVRFLYNNRTPNNSLNAWLSRFMVECLRSVLTNEPRLRDDKEKVDNLLNITQRTKPLEAFTVAFFGGQGGSPDHLTLTTLHSAKGLEYDIVIILGLEDGRLPYYRDSGETIREKRRLFYVGLTRARHEVHLVYSGWYQNRFGTFRNGRSRFLDEIEANL